MVTCTLSSVRDTAIMRPSWKSGLVTLAQPFNHRAVILTLGKVKMLQRTRRRSERAGRVVLESPLRLAGDSQSRADPPKPQHRRRSAPDSYRHFFPELSE